MKPAGYSGTPLAKKLGLKSGFLTRIVNAPDHYFELFKPLPDIVDGKGKKDFIHLFVKDAATLLKEIKKLKADMKPDGMLWVSWHKKTSGYITDVTEDIIRKVAIENGLVDVKVCAVDEEWSGLKLVIPLKDRK